MKVKKEGIIRLAEVLVPRVHLLQPNAAVVPDLCPYK